MRLKRLLILFIFTFTASYGQKSDLVGKVTFVTSQNAYVKFETTNALTVGDTLKLFRGQSQSCLVVKQLSSTSCVAGIIGSCEIKVNDTIVYPVGKAQMARANDLNKPSSPKNPTVSASNVRNKAVRGMISAASYSTLSAMRGDNHRTMYRLSFDANHINSSRFSLETYLNYRQNFIFNDSGFSKAKDVFNIYNLAMRYEPNSTTSLLFGRKINPKASSLGALDGLQAEKYFGNFYAGMLVGFRPDMVDFKFNSNLFQYGGYAGLKSENRLFISETTLGLLEQENKGNVDRRYTYFQHSSTIGRKVNLFSSFEIDLYNKVNNVTTSNVRVTNLFVSMGYQFSRIMDLNVAYDSRKQILFYETMKTEIERLLDNDQARQGLRARLNIRPTQFINAGLSYNKRYQSSGLNTSENINAYVNHSKIPGVGGRLSLNYNRNKSRYLESSIISIRHSRIFFHEKLEMDYYYRLVNYNYFTTESLSLQHYYGSSLLWRITPKITFTVLGEIATRTSDDSFRLNIRLAKNF